MDLLSGVYPSFSFDIPGFDLSLAYFELRDVRAIISFGILAVRFREYEVCLSKHLLRSMVQIDMLFDVFRLPKLL